MMIEGVGIDTIDVERITFNIEKNAGFKEMIFSENEIAYCESKAGRYEHFAARFAAKEAFLKALGTGWMKETNFNEIEIVHTNTGQPEIVLLGSTMETLKPLGITRILVSLSHLKTMACAVVIVENSQ